MIQDLGDWLEDVELSRFASPSIYIDNHHQTVAVSACATQGVVAEAIAAQWLINLGWTVAHHRWHCRWGEIDLIAYPQGRKIAPNSPQIMTFNQSVNQSVSNGIVPLVFVEVKGRSRGNWDANGLLSITAAKQAKLWKAAELFLSEMSPHAQYACRFDVILIRQGRSPHSLSSQSVTKSSAPADGIIPEVDRMLPIPKAIQPGRWIAVGPSRFCVDQHLQHAFEQTL
ncbi:MAG: YraN family protein [Elainellaceae cyanobacterium]